VVRKSKAKAGKGRGAAVEEVTILDSDGDEPASKQAAGKTAKAKAKAQKKGGRDERCGGDDDAIEDDGSSGDGDVEWLDGHGRGRGKNKGHSSSGKKKKRYHADADVSDGDESRITTQHSKASAITGFSSPLPGDVVVAARPPSQLLSKNQKKALHSWLEDYRLRWPNYWNYLSTEAITELVEKVPLAVDELANIAGACVLLMMCDCHFCLSVSFFLSVCLFVCLSFCCSVFISFLRFLISFAFALFFCFLFVFLFLCLSVRFCSMFAFCSGEAAKGI
jgi:hypothetical protein